jgi:hypothetical protein
MMRFARDSVGVFAALVGSVVLAAPFGSALGQQMGPSVTIAGPLPLPVKIPATVSVKNIDERGRNPYMVNVHCESSSSNSCNVATPLVPVGKRLVVEHINGTAQLKDPAAVTNWEVFVPSNSIVVATLPPHLVFDNGNINNLAANESVLLFVEAGQSMTAQIVASNLNVNMSMLFSGYLVDLSQ